MKINGYHHIIWDWNGTIFDDVKLCVNIINGLLAKRDLKTLSLDEYRDIFTFPVEKYYKIAGFDFSKEPFAIVGKEWMDQYESRKLECSIFAEVMNLFEKLRNDGVGQSILSAYSTHNLVELTEHFGIQDYFSNIVGLDHIYADSKLHLGLKLIAELENDPKEILLIGDTLHDSEVADELGVDCVLVATGHQSKAKLLQNGNTVFDSVKSLQFD